jgi:hypothetical protein
VVITDPTVSAGVLAGGTEDRKGFSVASAGDIAVAATANPTSSNKLRLVNVAALSFVSAFRLVGIDTLLGLSILIGWCCPADRAKLWVLQQRPHLSDTFDAFDIHDPLH